jgi:ABC-type phosphate transport system substrate-binding protein
MKAFSITLIIVLIAGSVTGWTAPAGPDIAVVVNRDVPIDDLTFSELRKILLGDRQYWSTNLRVTLLIRAPAARERDVILRSVLEMSEAQYRQYWIGKVFRAESSAAPKSISSNEMAFSLLNSIPGSIAFVDAAQVPKDLKVVRLGGLRPGDKGYPLN